MIRRAIWLAVALGVGCAGTVAAQEPAPFFVAIVRVPPGELPEKSFTLMRDGKPIPVLRDMQVLNGDHVVPAHDKRVTVVYAHPECGEKVVSKEEYLVSCSPTSVGTAGAFALFLKQLLPFVSKPERVKETQTFTARGSEDLSCFPPRDFQVSPWPPSGATLLAGELELFRWEGAGIDFKFCSPAALVITRVGGQGAEVQLRQRIRVGELTTLQETLPAGVSYEWVVTDPDGSVQRSPKYRFSVLDREDSGRISRQLEEVTAANPDYPAALVQALYLQVLSDATPALDLYADSLRLLQGQDASSDLFRGVAARAAEHE